MASDIDLFERYLTKQRQVHLQLCHGLLLGDGTAEHARFQAHRADHCDQLVKALRVLKEQPGKFIEEYLK